MPRAKKTLHLPTACFFRCNMLPQGSNLVGESSHTNSSLRLVGTAQMQKIAAENWFPRRNFAMSVDDSLCQGGHNDANSQPRACRASACHGVGSCLTHLIPDQSRVYWHLEHEPEQSPPAPATPPSQGLHPPSLVFGECGARAYMQDLFPCRKYLQDLNPNTRSYMQFLRICGAVDVVFDI